MPLDRYAMAKNCMGGFYYPGRPLPNHVREESEISKKLKISKGSVDKVLVHNANHGMIQPFCCGGRNPTLVTDDVLHIIEIYKLQKPRVTGVEIRQRLI